MGSGRFREQHVFKFAVVEDYRQAAILLVAIMGVFSSVQCHIFRQILYARQNYTHQNKL
jgi:hypothetical protein